jgi:hypothetical protein
MTDTFDDFGSYICRSSTVCICLESLSLCKLLCETEIYQLNVTVRGQHDIFRLQITINDILA